MALFLNVTLAKTDPDFGAAGSQVRIFLEHIVAIKEDLSSGHSILFVNKSGSMVPVEVTQSIDTWKSITLNPW